MAICQDSWGDPQRTGSLNIDQLTMERRGRYLVPAEGLVHIAEAAYFGEESSGGSVDVEMRAYCLTEISGDIYTLESAAPAERLVCQTCRMRHAYFLVDQGS